MNSLLKRQLKKYLEKGDDINNESLLKAVSESYDNYEDQIAMLGRAMKISSDELFQANKQLREEAISLKDINTNLKAILSSMNLELENGSDSKDFNLLEYIKKQSLEIVKMNKQREKLLQNLEQQNQSLNEYAHMVSHDLKAPLRSIDALINWFIVDNRDKLNENNKESLDLILMNVEKMDLLITGILSYSSIDKEKTENRVVDLNVLLKETINALVFPDHVSIVINENMPKVLGNNFRFKQLFQNLIHNAINFSDKEQSLIEVDFTEKPNEYEFRIKDNGIGIPKKYHDQIFIIFNKLENNTKSTGIGLSIAKKIVESYGGRIWVESKEGLGSVFYFTISRDHGATKY
ncbi:sensor histidine kinase [Flavobacterium frigoris]|uniref:histidine kinase n=1 Tax=Flavobacterium frigoris (strain PS1) TaxID=1086011 RepID=H7FP86_FLAFP|nr:ATP-binding protein [Flavobacterium frigoris]EIA09566.1 two-component sensor histidine kinase [Flavobacterium frigoris PS1]